MGGVQLELTDAEARYIQRPRGRISRLPARRRPAASTARNRSATRAAASWITTSAAATGRPSSSPALVRQTRKMTAANVVSVVRNMNHAWRSSLSGGDREGSSLGAVDARGEGRPAAPCPTKGILALRRQQRDPQSGESACCTSRSACRRAESRVTLPQRFPLRKDSIA